MIAAVWLVAVIVGALATSASVPHQADEIDRARDEVLGDDYQTEMPSADAPGDAEHPGSSRARMRRGQGHLVPVGADRRDEQELGGGGAFGAILQYLMWAILIVVAAFAAFWLGSELTGYVGDAQLPDATDDEDQRRDRAIVEKPLGDADELAARGLYTDAIHTLLLRTLQELVRSAKVRVGPAETSREILAKVPLIGDARGAFGDLITAVEITHFGGGVPDANDYARCRRQFNSFAAAFRAGPGLAA